MINNKKNPLKVLHICSAFSIDFPGGITNYLRTLAASQVSEGNSVYILDGGDKNDWEKSADGYMVRSARSTRVKHFSVHSKRDKTKSRELLRIIEKEQFDVVHFHLTIGVGNEFYRHFKSLEIPYYISLHDYFLFCPRITMIDYSGKNCGGPETLKCNKCVGQLDQITLLNRISKKIGVALPRIPSNNLSKRNFLIEGFFEGANAVLAVSERVKFFYQNKYPAANYVVSHIGSNSAISKRKAKIPNPKIRLTFIGTFAPFKGSEILEKIIAGSLREDLEFNFYGRVDRERWKKSAEKVGLNFHGSYEPSQLPEIMSNTDLGLVLPVWEDNAPQVVMEFLNYGIPVIATKMGEFLILLTQNQDFCLILIQMKT